ncbi:MAG: anti-sigma factor [Gammaproteobacteria bacterium]
MSGKLNPGNPQIRSALAAEYVLGTLRGGARRRFERLIDDNVELRREVEHWEANLYRLLDGLPDRTPPASVWRRIESEIGLESGNRIPAHSTGQLPPPTTSLVATLLNSLGFWRGWSLAASVVAVVLALALVLVPSSSTVTSMVVVTDDARSQASWVVSGEAGSREIRVRAIAPQAIEGDRVFQLWVLPAGETTVQSVGLIPASGQARLDVSESVAALLADAQKFGVSVEPPGGSPTGQPTTSPLYHGIPLVL